MDIRKQIGGDEAASIQVKNTNEGHLRSLSTSAVLVPRTAEQEPVVSVILPTLNEEEGIGECIQRIIATLNELDITGEIIVSDSSTDQTPVVAAEMGAFVVTPDQVGYGYAYRYAFEYARGEYVVMGDADMTYDFEELPKLLELVTRGEADMVMGSRLQGTILPGSMPALHRYIGNPLLTMLLNLFYGVGVNDAHSGFRVFRREVLDTLSLKTDGMEFASEMVMAAGANDLRIAEVPITYHKRLGEATLSSFPDGWRHVKFIMTNAPGKLFSVPAFGLMLAGIFAMVASVLGPVVGVSRFGTATLLVGSLLTIAGFQIGSLAAFSSIVSQPVRPSKGLVTSWIKRDFHLESALATGGLLIAMGGMYVAYAVTEWVVNGAVQRQLIAFDVFAVTAIVIGLFTVFNSLFIELSNQSRTSGSGSIVQKEPRTEDELLENEGYVA
ncbi:glycosyltransferase family 2 protein [Halococcus saccharolyticus]|uniref:Glycosyl transferase family 2 n=1 Tax=Halococcus saccharolyticus DSM 5350 TaxID=1227455 RepID=M0MNY1_9EURY|nr:glycosyltransferase family 2 protein [Halococcus saccharolyticus]EMA47053.1 glycosyl transferase family 2 [Halococcus saccharolyticus DSM 5350]